MRIIVTGQVDGDPCEDGLVEPFALFAHGFVVEPAGVAEQQEHQLKVLADHGHVLLAGRNQAVGVVYLGQYRCLANLEVFHRDGLVEVGIDQLLLPAFQLYQALSLVGEQGLVLLLADVQLDAAVLAHLLNGLLGELHLRLPDALDLLLDLLHRDIGQVAVCSAGVPAEAEEVAVDTAFAAGVTVAHASAAAVADQRALQVVGVPPRAVPGDTSPSQYLLHAVPRLVIHKGFMRTVVHKFVVADHARVVRVGEHAVDLAVVQRRADVLRSCAALQAALLKFIP
ncbi:MAG: hypothetical protein JWM52_494 [Candidatus Saccharibacteria bacterium]|nr:hypothetical protein [Candidatus Saccharibacteria bacterium]